MSLKVHGGIITDQMLKGRLRYYKITGPFTNTVSAGAIIIPNAAVVGGNPLQTAQFTVGAGMPVPGSAAEKAMSIIQQKCTIGQIAIISNSAIHIAIENTTNSWDTTGTTDLSSDAAANIQAAIVALGASVSVPGTSTTPDTVDMTTVTVTEVAFQLA